jgi:DNA-binding transcriptional LysR family regulator
MDKLRALDYFVAAAQEGSFAGAARLLDVTVPSVHKLVGALETQIGVKLFERTNKGLTLTASGETYLETSRPLLEELAALDRAVSRSADNPSGTLVIGAPSQLTHHLLLPALPRFRAQYPDIQIDFRVVQRPTEGDGTSVDVFVLHGWPEGHDLIHRRLGHARTLVAATPAYWSRRGVPQHPNDLTGHACLLVRNPAGILIDLWDFERGGERVAVKVSGWLSSTDREVILDSVMASEGCGRFNELSTRSLLQSGRLVPVLPDWEVQGGPPLNVLYRASHRRTPRVRVFLEFLGELLRLKDAEAPGTAHSGLPDLPQWHRRGSGRASSVLRRRL